MCKLFDEKSNARFRYYMKKYDNKKNRFSIISKKMPQYTPKQLSNHWRNYLDPRLCRKPLEKDEKKFVIRWVLNNTDVLGVIHWKELVRSLKASFNKTYSENDVKNYWYSQKRKEEPKKKRNAKKLRSCSRPHEKIPGLNQNYPTDSSPHQLELRFSAKHQITIKHEVNPPETDVIKSVGPRLKELILTTPINLPNLKPNQADQNQFIPCDLSRFTPEFNPTATPERHYTTHTSIFKPYKPIARRHTTDTSMPYGSQLPVEGPVEPHFIASRHTIYTSTKLPVVEPRFAPEFKMPYIYLSP